MKFSEAMEAMINGSKVTRQGWVGSIYFVYENKEVQSYQPNVSSYIYDETIMVSDNWKIKGEDNTYKFYEVIDHLLQGKKAYLEEWKDNYIYYDETFNSIGLFSLQNFKYTPAFESFTAIDWVIL